MAVLVSWEGSCGKPVSLPSKAEWMDKAHPPLPPPQGATMPDELGALSQGGFWTAVEGLICIYANCAWLISFPVPSRQIQVLLDVFQILC